MMILSTKHCSKPYYSHAATILMYVTLLFLFSPIATSKYLNHDASHREFSPKSNALFIGIALVVATMIVVIMFIIVNLYCKPLPYLGRAENGSGQQASKGLDPTVLESFPVFKYSEVAGLRAQAVPLECAVCLSSFEEDDEDEVLIRLLPKCKHVFHVSCSDLWLKDHTTCPICRCNLLSKSDDHSTKFGSNGVDLSRSQENQYDVFEVRLDIEEGQSGKYRRWYSMGHVAVGVQSDKEEGWKRYTLNLPEKDMKKFFEDRCNKFKRTRSSL